MLCVCIPIYYIVEKYDLVGRLLKPGEEPTDYTDTEEEHSASDRAKQDWLMWTVKKCIVSVGVCLWSNRFEYICVRGTLRLLDFVWKMLLSD